MSLTATAALKPVGAQSYHREVRAYSDEDRLLTILQEHGVAIYRPEDVDNYQKVRLQQVKALLIATTTGSVLASCMAVVFGIRRALAKRLPHWTIVLAAPGTGLALWSSDQLNELRWQSNSLSRHIFGKKRVPAEALARVELLDRSLVGLRFTVETIKLDPLLFVHFGTARFCIAAWNEPGFNAQLAH